MKASDVMNILEQEEEFASLTGDGYVSFLIPSDTLLQFKATRDENWYTATYAQLVYDEDDNTTSFVVQLEGLPEDPYSQVVNTNGTVDSDLEFPVRVFKRVK